ncbi:hypothetical protein RchiOBHm_Chr5g0068491 [Rosa chinensis]|uniref:Uncharacterized protein n=1 Tax=Rosa chinensis TaxID=74649 RepID=A0A2P6QJP5_ROSCH|nr:uncharacterized protein LOC112164047 [Rosa chinensis]PRQ34394.1 hypothetical protein RchiOBHm_Chr5g0068491 [Rosa chinensis]
MKCVTQNVLSSFFFLDISGYQAAKSLNAQKFLKKTGCGKEDYHWKQIDKALLCTYTLDGVAWLYNEKSPLGWWMLKPRPKEERELDHLYKRQEFPYLGDEEAMEEFVAKGGMIVKELQNKKFEQEVQRLWIKMRNKVILELPDKGYDVE